ncbi:hydroxymethylglutaryl-CoA synthase [Candidatus Gottesmanbacteria bacterium RIFCSPHIGHO2_02_FULL_39_11]|uniref:Hydroxymethylglutaryl-CoA synthase n=1 Tax=Candidatus Gottesmanbacteria bacterium RIFCSPHIGHO2_02_FULL_39_11 TaxID=1798382 RepID=A0A1F5ZTF6_9BACT|nr:MAG: hydroxymethylglutaryl-CoA synthase [Candidatus Gottesmanbacteria bacterium RIFCSPHIGHO2_02_FULL_39_11]
MNVDILGYGMYVPYRRISVSEIASVWGKNKDEISKSLGVSQKSVPYLDEDAVTLAYEAASEAILRAQINPTEIEACFVGSESHPYAVNPTSTIVAEFLGIGHKYLAADLEFACKAATTGIIATAGLIASSQIKTGLVIGSDTAQARPHDILEYTASSASAAYILGKDKNKSIATLQGTVSYSSDTPDFWRRDGVRFPSHGGRFTGEPSYFNHVLSASKMLLEKTKTTPSDYTYAVFHMPNGKFPRAAAKRLGFSESQIAPSLIVDHIGNPYSASSLCGLGAVLDIAKPQDKIFVVSYGSGAGSDAFSFEVNSGILERRGKSKSFKDFISFTKQISYVEYLKYGGKI